LINYLPYFLRKSNILKEIFNSEELQFDLINDELTDISNQTYIDSATWGLELFEKELGIITNPSKPISERRNEIEYQLKKSYTVKADKSAIELASNGSVSFDGRIIVKYTDVVGIPNDIETVKSRVSEIIPAHSRVLYIYLYPSINELDTMTIDEVSQMLIKDMGFDVLTIADAEKHYIDRLDEVILEHMISPIFFDGNTVYYTGLTSIPTTVKKWDFYIDYVSIAGHNSTLMTLISPPSNQLNYQVYIYVGRLYVKFNENDALAVNLAGMDVNGVYHIVIDYILNKVYINDVEIDTYWSPLFNLSSDTLCIGGKQNGTNTYSGYIYSVRGLSATDEVLYSWL
jgi:hypothetical protein